MTGLLASVDHLVYGVPDLDEAVEMLAARLGVRATPGGAHPGLGTQNALIALGSSSYLEIIGPDPAQTGPPLWFGLGSLSAPRLVTWAAKGVDLGVFVVEAAQHGVELGAPTYGRRQRADGVRLSWRLTDPRTVVADGVVPFFIDWSESAHPSAMAAGGTAGGITLEGLCAEHPAPAGVSATLHALGLDMPVTESEEPALIATIATPGGLVELR